MMTKLNEIPERDTFTVEATLLLFLKVFHGVLVLIPRWEKESHLISKRRPKTISRTQSKRLFNTVNTFCVAILTQLDIASHPHYSVVLNYFDIILRYSRFLAGRPVLQAILQSMLDHRGLRNPQDTIRTKACEIFSKIFRPRTLNQDFLPLLPGILSSSNI